MPDSHTGRCHLCFSALLCAVSVSPQRITEALMLRIEYLLQESSGFDEV